MLQTSPEVQERDFHEAWQKLADRPLLDEAPDPNSLPDGHAVYGVDADGNLMIPKQKAMYESFAFFMSELVDDKGEPLYVGEHHEQWCDAMQFEKRLVLLAPRDHGKTWTNVIYLMWRCWRHNRDENGRYLSHHPEGQFESLLFSDTYAQAGAFFEKMSVLILANEEIFQDIMPTGTRGTRKVLKDVWTGGLIRFRNLASVQTKAYMTSTRGLHPNLVICDDVLNDSNSATSHQRSKVWRYFVGTISPMLGPHGQLIVVGTAQHYSDLLHRLRTVSEFKWLKYRAVDWETGAVLWPERHNLQDLMQRRDMDPVLFSKEYQNDPRDDSSSLFPHSLTQPAIDQGAGFKFLPAYTKRAGEFVVLSADFALSEQVGADYCVINVARLDMATQRRQLLWAVREKAWGFQTQVDMLRMACSQFDVDIGVIENNSFQRWVRQETEKYPETAGVIVGHTTGIEKTTLKDGVPGLIIALRQGLWQIPDGKDPVTGEVADPAAHHYAMTWQSELNAYGWVDDKLQGAGEHDDTVIAFWLLERAVRLVNTILKKGPPEQYVTMAELGIERVQIGAHDW